MKKITSIFCTAAMLLSLVSFSAFALEPQSQKEKVKAEMELTANYMLSTLSQGAKYTDDAVVYLILKSGVECQKMKDEYLTDVKKTLDENDGKLMFGTSDSAVYYASTALNLDLLGENPSSFYGYNLIKSLENFDRDVLLGYSIYQLPTILNAAYKFDGKIIDKTLAQDVIKAITSTFDETGAYDYWGLSVDNNGVVVPALANYYDTNALVKVQLDKALEWTYKQKKENGYMSSPAYPDNGNADSTGYALSMFSVMAKGDKAREAFDFLVKFKSDETQGMYTSYGSENDFATKDAFIGLVAYYNYLVETQEPETSVTTTQNETTTNAETTSLSQNTNNSPTSPNTGDDNHFIVFGIAAAAAVAVIVIVAVTKKKNK